MPWEEHDFQTVAPASITCYSKIHYISQGILSKFIIRESHTGILSIEDTIGRKAFSFSPEWAVLCVFVLFCFICLLVVLEMEPRALTMLGGHSTTKLYPHSSPWVLIHYIKPEVYQSGKSTVLLSLILCQMIDIEDNCFSRLLKSY